MSSYQLPGHLGTIQDFHGEDVNVGSDNDGVTLWWPETGNILQLGPDGRDKLRELLDRAAMPGQPEAIRHPVYACCLHCEHCGNEQCQQARGRHCEHGADQPPHDVPCKVPGCEQGSEVTGEAVITVRQPPALTVAAVDPAAMDALGELADAAREAGGDG